MSVSVDDLVASFNSNHIGQEAIDLANLQAQLAQALRNQASTSAQPIQRRAYPPSNTPLARTPSSSMCWEPSDFMRARSSSAANATQLRGIDENKQDVDAMDEDERMVEDMLFASPVNNGFSNPALPSSPATYSGMVSRRPSVPHVSSTFDMAPAELPSPNTSHFATTDPFFIAQMQAAQAPAPSFFAHAGCPSAHSPFTLQSAFGQHAHHPIASEVDPAHMFASSPAAFSC
ncbi:uncharacterized protein C8Q71DRAFT_852266 [Rhodofomes roseus]|uniref:Uncharacterized protein n=1 Tax=Rhodofomes roseus TaxID=34475 RepID=A0ABQ8KXY2_9APHY|nr:uncharacterized protein C8Q71DRAFT_852266 [Rhodofomes roseus]KAH9843745.1 hypothetical protein C8Q71DRAFT_852266 [Rhodofomes roseus]